MNPTPRLIVSVTQAQMPNPFVPQSWFNRAHTEVILWRVPSLPESFALTPRSSTHVMLSVIVPQRAHLVRLRSFTRCDAPWQTWDLTEAGLTSVRAYLQSVKKRCIDGSIRYDLLRFNCLHFALACLQRAGVMTSGSHARHNTPRITLAPRLFVGRVMPEARVSVMYHDLMPFCTRDGAWLT
jgi:hypothetical protein